jgi:hypothetical protein
MANNEGSPQLAAGSLHSRLGLPVDLIFGKEQLYPPIRQEFNREAVLIYGQLNPI